LAGAAVASAQGARAVESTVAEDLQGCDPRIVAAVVAETRVDLATEPDIMVGQACKAFPSRPHTVIAAVGLRRSQEIVDVHLALWNESASRIEARGVEPIEEDASLKLTSVGIDTAPYRLAPDVRAFGVDVDGYSQANCADGGVGPARRLFVQDGARLRRVLGPMNLSTWWLLSSGNDVCHHADPEPPTIIESYERTIALGPHTSHGYRDLVVTILASRDDGQASMLPPLVHVLHYDGREYPTKSLDAAFWAWRDQVK
jgi:hypothetical protein